MRRQRDGYQNTVSYQLYLLSVIFYWQVNRKTVTAITVKRSEEMWRWLSDIAVRFLDHKPELYSGLSLSYTTTINNPSRFAFVGPRVTCSSCGEVGLLNKTVKC